MNSSVLKISENSRWFKERCRNQQVLSSTNDNFSLHKYRHRAQQYITWYTAVLCVYKSKKIFWKNFVDSGFVKTCDELVIDLKILGQLADLLSGVDEEVLPLLMKSLEPILPGSFWQDLFQWPFLHNLNSAAFTRRNSWWILLGILRNSAQFQPGEVKKHQQSSFHIHFNNSYSFQEFLFISRILICFKNSDLGEEFLYISCLMLNLTKSCNLSKYFSKNKLK